MHPTFDKPFTFDRVIRIIITVAVIIGIFLLLKKLSNVLVPFFLAWLLAYLIHPLVNFLQYKARIKYRGLAVFVSMTIVFIIVAVFVALIAQPIKQEVSRMTYLIENYASSHESTKLIPEKWQEYLKNIASLPEVQSFFNTDNISKVLEKLLPRVWSVMEGSLNILFTVFVVFITILYIFFILLDYEKISDGWIKIFPERYRHFVFNIAQELEDGMNKYFRGQAIIALTVGVLSGIGLSVIDLPLAVILGVLIGILSLVPYMKTLILIPATLMALLKSMETGQSFGVVFLGVLVVLVGVQVFEEAFLIPRVMGKRMGLNPAIILLSLSIWGALLGVVGMIIALPFTTLIVSYYRHFVLFEDDEGNPVPEDEAILIDDSSRKKQEN